MSKKRVSVDSYRYPAVVSPGSLRRNSAVDVGYSDRSKRLATGGEPVEELVDTAKFAADWTCPAKVPDTYLIYTATVSNARGLFPPSVECLRRGL